MNSLPHLKYKLNIFEKINKNQILFILLTCFYLLINGALYTTSYQEIHLLWTTAGDLDFGYLLFGCALFYGFKRFQYLTTIKPFYNLLAPLLALSIIHFIGQLFDVKTFRLLAIVIGWPLFIGVILGEKYFKTLLLPTALIVMAMPAWYLLIPLLQTMTVFGVTSALSLIDIPIFIDTNFIHIPNGVIHVAGGCSGLKYLQTAIALSIIMALLQDEHWKKVVITAIFAFVLAVISNWTRVFILVLVGHYSGLEHPLMTDHDNLGWAVFLVALIPLIIIDRKLIIINKKDGSQYKEKPHSTVKFISLTLACACVALPYILLIILG